MANKPHKNKWFWIALFIGAFVLFAINNFWPSPVPYKAISCTYNKFNCLGGSSGGGGGGSCGWNGTCTREISLACCENIDYCSGQLVDNPFSCLHLYCKSSGSYCKPIAQYSNGDTAYIATGYRCECSTIEVPR